MQVLHIQTSDPDRNRRGQIIALISLLQTSFSLLFIPIAFTFSTSVRNALLAALCLSATIYGFTYWLARSDRINLAAWLMLSQSIALSVTVAAIVDELLLIPLLLTFTILTGGLILPSNRLWLIFVANMAAFFLSLRLLSDETIFEPQNGGQLISITVLIGLLALLSYIGARINERSLAASIQAQEEVQAASRELEAVNNRLEEEVQKRTAALQHALKDLGKQADEQARLLKTLTAQRELIAELGVPILPISDSVLVMPLVGVLDSQRIDLAIRRSVETLERTRSRRLIVDITGVPIVDSQVAQGLLRIAATTRLLGADTLLVGVKPEVAQTLVGLGVDLSSIKTTATLQSAMALNSTVPMPSRLEK